MISKKTKYFLIALGLIVLTLMYLVFRPTAPPVVSTNPENTQKYVLDDQIITIVFSRSLNNSDSRQLSLDITPKLNGKTSFISNTLVFDPLDIQMNQAYNVKLLYNNTVIHEFSFTTNPYTLKEIDAQGQQQIEDDYLYNQAVEEALKEYPWYPKLPILTTKYTIFYDFDLNSFRVRLKNQSISEEEKTQISSEALEDLKKIGVNEPIEYVVLEPNE